MSLQLTYSNLPERPTGPALRRLGRVLPGIASVQRQVEPYALAWQRDTAAALAAGGPLWVALGDSMTQGVGASGHRRGWVGVVAQQLADRGDALGVVNLSVTGARLQDVLDRQLPALQVLLDQEADVRLVTLLAGSNDVLNRRHRPGATDRLAEVLDQLPPGAVVGNLPNPLREVVRMDALLRQRQRRGDLRLADFRRDGPRTWIGKVAPDWFHPNDRGYRVMAGVVQQVLSPTRWSTNR